MHRDLGGLDILVNVLGGSSAPSGGLAALTDEEWNAPSAAAGWRIADVVSHIGATARSTYTPSGLVVSLAKSLESVNEGPVEKRRSWGRARVMAEYNRATRRAIALLAVVSRSRMRAVRAPLAELGRFPLGLFIGEDSGLIDTM